MGIALALINLLGPTAINWITVSRNPKTGVLTVVAILDEGDAENAANQKLVADFMAAHKTP